MPRRAKPAPSGRSCRECIHECACVMQCGGNPTAPSNATRCACPPFQGLNSLERDCEEAGKIYPNTVCAECWEKWLEITKEAE